MPTIRLVDRPDFTMEVADDSALLGDSRYELIPDQDISPTAQETIDTTSTVQTDDGQYISSQDTQTYDTVTEQQANPLEPSPFFNVEGTETLSEDQAQQFISGSNMTNEQLLRALYPGMSDDQIAKEVGIMDSNKSVQDFYRLKYARESASAAMVSDPTVLGGVEGETQTVTDPVTGETTEVPVAPDEAAEGGASSVAEGTTDKGEYIPNEDALEDRIQELKAAGVPSDRYGEFITSPDSQGRLFFKQPATLVGPNGETEIVATGSARARDLFAQNYTLGGGKGSGGDVIGSDAISPEADIKTGDEADADAGITPGEVTVEVSKELDKYIKEYMEILNPPESELSTREDSIVSELDKLYSSLEGEEAMLQEELAKASFNGLTIKEMQDKLRTINNEINTKTAAFEKRLALNDRSVVAQFIRTGTEAQSRRVYQADIMFLQSQAQNMLGNIEYAQELAQDAVDVKYKPILKKIEVREQQLNLIAPYVNEEEGKYADAVNLALQQERADTELQMAKEKEIQNLKIDAWNAGITDMSILKDIGSANSVDEALNILMANAPAEGGVTTGTTGGGGYVGNGTVSTSDVGITDGATGRTVETGGSVAQEVADTFADKIQASPFTPEGSIYTGLSIPGYSQQSVVKEVEQLEQDIISEFGNVKIAGKAAGQDYLDEVIANSSKATYYDLYTIARRVTELSIKDTETFLRARGFFPGQAPEADAGGNDVFDSDAAFDAWIYGN